MPVTHSPSTRRVLNVESLESREVPSVTVNDNPTNYQINIDAGERVAVGFTADGDLRVTVDGVDLGIPTRAAGTITMLTVTATGNFSNTIDLTGVTTAGFTSLTKLTVQAGGGSDTIIGSQFAETLHGDAGADTISGNGGNDIVRGGSGNDVVRGASGNDQVYGGSGNDQVYGGSGNDTIDGGDGNDTLDGSTGSDKLLGGAGNDKLTGGSGIDKFTGGPGIDKFIRDRSDIFLDNTP